MLGFFPFNKVFQRGGLVNKGRMAIAVAFIALAASWVAGCGGGNDETLTKAEYVRQGNAICGKWQQARGDMFQSINQELKPPVTQKKKEDVILQLLAPYGTATEGLAELPLPDGAEKEAEAVVTAMEDGLAQAKANPGTLISSNVPFAKSNELAEDFGLTECRA
jgi:hypothetical protein